MCVCVICIFLKMHMKGTIYERYMNTHSKNNTMLYVAPTPCWEFMPLEVSKSPTKKYRMNWSSILINDFFSS